jgi:hypothetical protein
VGGSEHVISYCAEDHGGRGIYLNKIEKDYSNKNVKMMENTYSKIVSGNRQFSKGNMYYFYYYYTK